MITTTNTGEPLDLDACPGSEYGHAWVGGMIYIDSEDVEACAAVREIECEHCGATYGPTGMY